MIILLGIEFSAAFVIVLDMYCTFLSMFFISFSIFLRIFDSDRCFFFIFFIVSHFKVPYSSFIYKYVCS